MNQQTHINSYVAPKSMVNADGGVWNMSSFPEYIKAICQVKAAALLAAGNVNFMASDIAARWADGYLSVADSATEIEDFRISTYRGFGTKLLKTIDVVVARHLNVSHPCVLQVPESALLATAMHVVVLNGRSDLVHEVGRFTQTLETKAKELEFVKKPARKFLREMGETTLGKEFSTWANGFESELKLLKASATQWGTSWLGRGISGIDCPSFFDEKFASVAANKLTDITGYRFVQSQEEPDYLNLGATLLAEHGLLQTLSVLLWRTAHDIRLMCSGPRTGFSEITIPAVAPGSSIMPGKLNPVMVEMIYTSVDQIDANHAGLALALKSGWLETSAFSSIIMRNYLESHLITVNSLRLFNDLCVAGIKVSDDAL